MGIAGSVKSVNEVKRGCGSREKARAIRESVAKGWLAGGCDSIRSLTQLSGGGMYCSFSPSSASMRFCLSASWSLVSAVVKASASFGLCEEGTGGGMEGGRSKPTWTKHLPTKAAVSPLTVYLPGLSLKSISDDASLIRLSKCCLR